MYQKCVCFIFLVILAVLSCSGFRIDSLTMTDFDKKNYHTSPNTQHFRLENDHRPHRIRHHRLWRTHRYPKQPHIDVVVYPPPPPPVSKPSSIADKLFWPYKSSRPRLPPTTPSEVPASLNVSTNFPNENLAQIPPTAFSPVEFVVSRSQRSPDHPRRNRWSKKQEEDIFNKAYKATFVVLVRVESKNFNESGLCIRYVKVIRDFKGNAKKSFGTVNDSLMYMLNATCDLVKKMMITKKYMLLLDEKKQLLDTPKPKEKLRQAMRKKISRVCKLGFEPTKPQIVKLKEVEPKSPKNIGKPNRILICRVKGFPAPKITWRRRNEVLHPNKSYNILYKRRQSKLIIKKPDAEYLGVYECVAESSNGNTTTKNLMLSESSEENFTFKPPQLNKECPEKYKRNYCLNGGTCQYEGRMEEFFCSCPEGYGGLQCEEKKPSNTRILMDEPPRQKAKYMKNRRNGGNKP